MLAIQQHIGVEETFLQAYDPDAGEYKIVWRTTESDGLMPGTAYLMTKFWMCLDGSKASFGVRNIRLMDLELDLAAINGGRPLQPRYYALKCSTDEEGIPYGGKFTSIEVDSAASWAAFLDSETGVLQTEDLCPIEHCMVKGDHCVCDECANGFRLSPGNTSCDLDSCEEALFPNCESFKVPPQDQAVTHSNCGCHLCKPGAICLTVPALCARTRMSKAYSACVTSVLCCALRLCWALDAASGSSLRPRRDLRACRFRRTLCCLALQATSWCRGTRMPAASNTQWTSARRPSGR